MYSHVKSACNGVAHALARKATHIVLKDYSSSRLSFSLFVTDCKSSFSTHTQVWARTKKGKPGFKDDPSI